MTGGARPQRERVTSLDLRPARGDARGPAPAAPRPRAQVGEAETLFTRSLMRAHGRLALACIGTFLVAVALVTLAISRMSQLHDLVVWGVPLPWLVHAYGFYPLILVWAIGYALAAVRIERRFTSLVEPE